MWPPYRSIVNDHSVAVWPKTKNEAWNNPGLNVLEKADE